MTFMAMAVARQPTSTGTDIKNRNPIAQLDYRGLSLPQPILQEKDRLLYTLPKWEMIESNLF